MAFLMAQDGIYEVIAQVSTAQEAIEQLARRAPQVVVMDLLLPEQGGLEVLRCLRREFRHVRVLIFSGTRNPQLLQTALNERPHGYVCKCDSLEMFHDALRTVSEGGTYWTPYANEILDQRHGSSAAWAGLSDRERQILRLVAEGMSSKEVAVRLVISSKTVDNHRSNLMQKLGVRNATALTRFALQHGLVSQE